MSSSSSSTSSSHRSLASLSLSLSLSLPHTVRQKKRKEKEQQARRIGSCRTAPSLSLSLFHSFILSRFVFLFFLPSSSGRRPPLWTHTHTHTHTHIHTPVRDRSIHSGSRGFHNGTFHGLEKKKKKKNRLFKPLSDWRENNNNKKKRTFFVIFFSFFRPFLPDWCGPEKSMAFYDRLPPPSSSMFFSFLFFFVTLHLGLFFEFFFFGTIVDDRFVSAHLRAPPKKLVNARG